MRFGRALFTTALTATFALMPSCARSDDAGTASDDGARVPEAASPDSDQEAGTAPEAGPCTDCEYFPEACSADALCPNGPFGPSELDPQTEILVIRGRGINDVWVAGVGGGLAHFDGTSWVRMDLGTQETLRVMWLRESGEVILGLLNKLYARGPGLDAGADASTSDGGWWQQTIPRFGWGIAALNLVSGWSAAGSNILWTASLSSEPTEGGLWRLHASSPSTFEVLDGVPPGRCADIPCHRMLSIHGASAKTLWAVGEAGAAIRLSEAESDTPAARPFNSLTSNALRGVWAASDSEAWAVGARGTIRHYRGDPTNWEVVDDVPTKEALNGVWGTSTNDVWAVGDAGVVLHYDGSKWSRVKVAGLGTRRPNLNVVWAPAPGHLWIGGQGTILSIGGQP